MPKIQNEEFYGSAQRKIERLNLGSLLDEVRTILTGFSLRVLEEPNQNGAGIIRKMIDSRFADANGWTMKKTGGIDWKKCLTENGTSVCVGVEIQLSGRSELIYRDLAHFRSSLIEKGEIDLGIEVVPSDLLATFLTERVSWYSYANKLIRETRSDDLPLVLIGLEHDGPSLIALAKERTNLGRST